MHAKILGLLILVMSFSATQAFAQDAPGITRGARVRLEAAWPLLALLPAVAGAQTPAPVLSVVVGQRVRITSIDGRVIDGTVARLTPASIEIATRGTGSTNLASTDVRRIQVPDSVRDGAIKGGVAGGLTGAAFIGVLIAGSPKADDATVTLLATTAVSAGIGALIGATLDGAKLQTVFHRSDGGVTVGLGPLVSAAGTGVRVRVRW